MTRLEDDEQALEALERFSAHTDTLAVWRAPGGARYALAGVWSTGQRAYEYQHLTIAGQDARESPYAEQIGCWKGAEAREAYAGCNSKYDGDGYHESGKYSVVVLYRIHPSAPLWIKYGNAYRSSGGNYSGGKWSHYYACDPHLDNYHGYLRATRAFRAAQAAQVVPPTAQTEAATGEAAGTGEEAPLESVASELGCDDGYVTVV